MLIWYTAFLASVVGVYLYCKSLSFLIFSLLMCSITFFVLKRIPKYTLKYYAIAFSIGCLLMVVLYHGYLRQTGYPYLWGIETDDTFFEKRGREIFYNGQWNFIVLRRITSEPYTFYIWIIALLYAFGSIFDGFHTMIPRILNIFLWIFTMVYIDKIVDEKFNFDCKTRKVLLCFLTYFPNIHYLNAFTFRDTLVTFLLVLGTWSSFNINKIHKKSFVYLLISVISVFFLFFLRDFAAIVLLVIIIYNIWNESQLFGKVILASFLLFYVMYDNYYLMNYYNKAMNLSEYYTQINHEIALKRDSLVQHIVEIPILPFGIIVRFLFGFMQPSPNFEYVLYGGDHWLIRLTIFLVQVGTIFLIGCFPYFLNGLYKTKKIAVIFILTYNIYLTSLTFRHILLCYPFMFAIISKSICESFLVDDNKCLLSNKYLNRKHIMFILLQIGAWSISLLYQFFRIIS